MKLDRTGIAPESADGALCSRGCPQVVRSANPHAAFERLEAHTQRFGSARGLSAAGNLAVCKICPNQVDQGGTGLARIGRRQRMREDSRLNFVSACGVAEHRPL